MMDMMRKGSLILLLICIILSLYACGNNTDVLDKDTTATTQNGIINDTDIIETEEEMLKPDVPNETFDGYNFRILNIEHSSYHWATHTLTAEQQNGEVLNDSIYQRNSTIEELLDIEITDEQIAAGNIGATIQRNVSAGDEVYDAAMMPINSQGTISQSGYLIDWYTIPYIDLEKPWWSQTTNSQISIKNKLFFAAGDIGLAYYDAVMPIAFNLNIAQDHNLDDPYQLVIDGKWTADKLAEMMRSVTIDLDGNGDFTSADQYGMLGVSEEYIALIVAFGENVIKKDKDDIPYLAINEESFQRAFEKSIQTMNYDDVFLNYRLPSFGDTTGISLVQVFTGGRALMYSDVLYHLSAFRDMEDDFAILPRVKYDESQQEYYSYIHQSVILMCIPSTSSNLERTGIVLESLAAESKYTVIKTYYDIVLSQKYARDAQSIEMLDILFKNRVVDLGSVFNWGTVNQSIESQAENANTDIASLYAKIEPTVAGAIEKFVEIE